MTDCVATPAGQVRSFSEIVRRRARLHPQRRAFTFLPDGETVAGALTYGELDRRACAVAAALAERGLAGERALLLLPPGRDFVAAFLGCLYAGVVAVPADPAHSRRGLPRLWSIARDARPAAVLTLDGLAGRLRGWLAEGGPGCGVGAWLAVDALPDGLAEGWRDPGAGLSDLAFLQYTSGSTGGPKGVVIRHRHLLDNEERIRRAFRQDEETVVVGWLPLFHDMGLIGNLLQPLYVGGSCVLMPPAAFLQKPVRWLRAIAEHGATTSGGPDFAYDLCVRKVAPAERAGLDLSRWRVAFNGAEPVRAETLERFAAAFGPCGFRAAAFQPCYGLAEATLLVAAAPAPAVREGEGGGRQRVSCGPVAAGEVAVVDPETCAPVAPGAVGEVWVRGGSVADGYWGREEASAEAFGARLASGEGPYLRTGDLGLVEGGELYVTGRRKDLVILRGRNHYPQDLESTAEASHPALVPGGAAAFSVDLGREERLVVAAELERRAARRPAAFPEIAAAVRQAVAAGHGAAVWEVVLLPPGGLPRTTSGKVRRSACREAWRAGTLGELARIGAGAGDPDAAAAAALAASGEGGTGGDGNDGLGGENGGGARAAALAAVAARVLRLDPARLDRARPLTAQGLDSLAAAELQHEAAVALGVDLTAAELLDGAAIADLAARLAAGAEGGAAAPGGAALDGLPPADPRAPHPLAAVQKAFWFLQRLAPDSAAYNVAVAGRLAGPLDPAALEAAAHGLVARHGALRTVYGEEGGLPWQRVLPAGRADWAVLDIGPGEDGAGRSWPALSTALAGLAEAPFDLAAGRLLRVRLVRLGEEEHALLLAVHHLAIDGWSLWVLLDDLRALYAAAVAGAAPALPALPWSYLDHVRREERLLASPEGERLFAHWRERLAGELAPLDLPADRPRPAVPSGRGGALDRRLGEELVDALRAFAAAHGTTLYTVLLAGFAALLGRVTGRDDLIVGAAAAGRGAPELERVVGCFFNAVPLRADLAGDPGFGAAADRLRRTLLDALAHQAYPSHLLAERLLPGRDPGRVPLFQQVLFLSQKPRRLALSLPPGEEVAADVDLGALELRLAPLPRRFARSELEIEVLEAADGCLAGVRWSADLFDPATAARLAAAWQELLRAGAADPARPLSALPLLGRAERAEVLARSGGWLEPAAAGTVVDLFVARARRTPGAPAVVAPGGTRTYAELAARAAALARRLRELGAGPAAPVGIHLGREADLPAAVLAALAAGAAYVPLDPMSPRERLARMTDGVGVLVTRGRRAPSLPAGPWAVLDLDEVDGEAAAGGVDALASLAHPDLPVYALYTSGSTGVPKGALIRHRAFAALVAWYAAELALGPDDRVLLLSAFGFDLTQKNLFAPLAAGAALHVTAPETYDPALVAGLLESERITVVNCTPSALAPVLDRAAEGGFAALASLRWAVLGGEPVVPARLAAWRSAPACRAAVLNTYGPTECTDVVSRFRLLPPAADEPSSVPIGFPVAGARLLVVDRRLELLPDGVPGELAVGGGPVGLGYLGDPARTAEAFVPDPAAGEPGARLYRTGDVARRRADGALEFHGRRDGQVKVRGVRVELGEIEAALAAHPTVRQAAAGLRRLEGGDRLVAWLSLHSPQEPAAPLDEAGLRAFLRTRLPAALLPDLVVTLPALPLTATGKVDRRALPDPAPAAAPRAASGRPRTPAEEVVAGICAEVLGRAAVGREDDLFDLGCHSLAATQIVARVRAALGVDLPVAAVFEHPTAAGLAALVEAGEAGEAGGLPDGLSPPPLVRATRDAALPLSFPQERLWFLHRLDASAVAYHVPRALRVVEMPDGRLDLPVLERTFDEIIRRHEILRTTFPAADGRPVQAIGAPWPIRIPVVDLAALPAAAREARVRALLLELGRQPFDLERGPLLRLTLLRVAPGHHVLAINEHHFVHDGWTQGVLVREFLALYRAFAAGLPSPLPEPRFQFADFAWWQRQWIQGEVLARLLAWWTRELAGVPPLLQVPADRPRPAALSAEGAMVRTTLPAPLADRVRALGRREGASLFMTLLAAFAGQVERYTGQGDLVFGTGIANRRSREVEDMLGMVINTIPLRVGAAGDPAFRALLARTRKACLGAFTHQDLPFEKLVEALRPERSRGHLPLVQILFSFLDTPMPELALPGLEVSLVDAHNRSAKADVNIVVVPRGEQRGAPAGEIDVLWEYSSDLFDPATAVRMLDQYVRLLEDAVARPGAALGDLALLSAAERHQIAHEWGDGGPRPPFPLAPHAIAAQAARRPQHPAVVGEGESLTYVALVRRAAAVAGRLRGAGVGPGAVVAVSLERTPGMVAALLGIWGAGGAYVPLDPSLPPARAGVLFADSGAAVLLTEAGLAPALRPAVPDGVAVLLLEEVEEAAADEEPPAPAPVGADDLAYVLFTSGSTGRPKGVAVAHGQLAAFLGAALAEHALGEDEVVTAFAALSFDLSVFELFGTLAAGGTVLLESPRPVLDLERFLGKIGRATRAAAVPAVMTGLLEVAARRGVSGRPRTVFSGGEAVPPELLAALRRTFPASGLRMLYGPTETTVFCIVYRVPERIPDGFMAGRPIPGVRLQVVDPAGRPVPAGIPGELIVAGDMVSRGYLGRPDLTAERFVPGFGGDGGDAGRAYRTGDLARFRPDGVVEFLGRMDGQVKVRGFRIEVGEVEAVLVEHPAVQAAAVVARAVPGRQDRRLVAYVVRRPEAAAGEADLRAFLAGRLAEYMVPSAWVFLAGLPLNAAGKVDRRALPEPAAPAAGGGAAALPSTPTEVAVAAVWRELLGLPEVGVHDSFFELGGHSLLATQLVSRLQLDFGVNLPLARLFDEPTVAGVARVVEELQAAQVGEDRMAELLAELDGLSEEDVERLLAAEARGEEEKAPLA